MTRIVVLGDVLLDRDIIGSAERLCPDAPAPVVDERDVIERPGGAGFASVLARRHGADVTLLAPLSGDGGGRTLRRLLDDAGVELAAVHDDGTTVEKIRVCVDGRSLLRLDRGTRGALGDLPPGARELIRQADAVLVADYGGGSTSAPDVRAVLDAATRAGTPVVWDPHPRGTRPTPAAALVTPNRAEALQFDPGTPERPADAAGLPAVAERARRLRQQWGADAVSITLGDAGAVAVLGGGAPLVVPVDRPVAAADPCGAGDAFAVAATIALASGATTAEAVHLAVGAAAEFVAGGGAGTLMAVPQPDAFDLAGDVGTRADAVRRAGGVVVATGGCFDVLHRGHVATLQRARKLGDCLVVLLNSDESVRRLKGPGRPAQRAGDREAVLRSLGCVDDVIVFDDDTPISALQRLRPDVFVKGGDYVAAELPESGVVARWGGIVVTVPYLAGHSSTRILERIPSGGPHVV
jgi:D-beta-D-heptose 7-phosphate kinase / D-beta-D-heptose 1-phosphate adenosyltransferase